MLKRPFLLFPFILSSCALFQTQNIQDKSAPDLIRSIKATGEGRGRLGIEKHQYLFSYDAILKENTDWLLAANIPLHGEEILVLPTLKEEVATSTGTESLELRIERGIGQYLKEKKQPPQLARTFLKELRSLMRFILHEQLQLKVSCEEERDRSVCSQGSNSYIVESTSQKLTLKKPIIGEYEIEFIAQNLTDSIFTRGSVFLHSVKPSSKRETLLSLELFWK